MDKIENKYKTIRQETENICSPLIPEDYIIQSIPEVSPAKWHLAHVSWFFENFILLPFKKDYRVFNDNYNYIFNSYYNSVGKMLEKNKRNILSRPSIQEIYDYRKHIDNNIQELVLSAEKNILEQITPLMQIGLNHEQQHQELLMMDIKNNFYHNPLKPAYINSDTDISVYNKLEWIDSEEAMTNIGHDNEDFCFDNEKPLHKTYVRNFKIASRPVLNGEFLEFINAGGYDEPKYWLSDGWVAKNQEGWFAPLYWQKEDNEWLVFTLNGNKKLDENQPVCHISYYEAEAFAHWSNKRLPTEFEWEHIAKQQIIKGNFLESKRLQPFSDSNQNKLKQIFGDVWEWTNSAYLAYPGFNSLYEGLGEYNGKFMVNQMVLRGGCCVTPESHIRATYRNFFYPQNRWQFSGMRLVKDD